ncbi:dihydrolipoamide acetyltransferase family protein [Taklimakanibacter deserti]|uniref:dihydrolipoamide acetyltransferase family protein n=1 Tax=Taklimakanibacter deserti TaxID=2267839 RepID=UPI000E65851B
MSAFRLPDLGEGLVEAEIVQWHVSPGDHVVVDQPLVSVETAKAVVELPSPQAGRIASTLGKVGDVVRVGDILVEYSEGGEIEKAGIVGDLPQSAIKASPAVRAKAAALSLDLSRVKGTGPDGTITLQDLEAQQAGGQAENLVRLTPARRSMASNMSRAHAEVVPATVTEEADVSAWPATEDVTLKLIGAIVSALQAHPALGAWYDAKAQTLRLHQTINLGIAHDTPEGLFVPVLRDAGSRSAAELRRDLDGMKRKIADRTIGAADMLGATFTLSNFGTIAGLHAELVLMPPQVAILGSGRIVERPLLYQGKVAPGRVMPLSLTFDHRALTGGEAARFLREVVEFLQSGKSSRHG